MKLKVVARKLGKWSITLCIDEEDERRYGQQTPEPLVTLSHVLLCLISGLDDLQLFKFKIIILILLQFFFSFFFLN